MNIPLSKILHKLLTKNHTKLRNLSKWSFSKDFAALNLHLHFHSHKVTLRFVMRNDQPAWKNTRTLSISILQGNATTLEMGDWIQFFRILQQLDQGQIEVDGLPQHPIEKKESN